MTEPVSLAEKRLLPDEEVVDVLKLVLREAEAGRVRSVALAYTHVNDGPGTRFSWRCGADPNNLSRALRLYAGVNLLCRDIEDDISEAVTYLDIDEDDPVKEDDPK